MISYTNNRFAHIKTKPTKKRASKQGRNLINSGLILPRVANEQTFYVPKNPKPRTYIRQFAKDNLRDSTPAENEFNNFLLSLNGGILKGRFVRQHVFSPKWILDFFFPELRLGIEIDGQIHSEPKQIARDKRKERDCEKFDITLVRFTNSEVFGDKVRMIEKLRTAWKTAKQRKTKVSKRPIFADKNGSNNFNLYLIICKSCGHTRKKHLSYENSKKSFKCQSCCGEGLVKKI